MKTLKTIYRFFGAAFLMTLGACSSETELDLPDIPQSEFDGYTTVGVSIPEMDIATRSLGETANLNNLKLHMMLFDARGAFLRYLSQDNGDITVKIVENGKVYYKVKLPYSSSPMVVHLVASEYDINYQSGLETTSMSALELTDNQDAYWNRVVLPNGIGSYDDDNTVTAGDEKTLLNDIKLVRNFAKVNVTIDSSISANSYGGFALLNQPTSGTVVPYITSVSGVDASHFADYNVERNANQSKYDIISSTFTGWEPADNSLKNLSATESDITTAPKYIYERSYHNVASYKPSFVVIKAKFEGTDYYYHIDLVKLDAASGQQSALHLLRNFEYRINITAIRGQGYATLSEAIASMASNNISYSLDTRDLYTISNSDGDKISVDYFQKTFVTAQSSASLGFQYWTNNDEEFTNANDMQVAVIDNESGVLTNGNGTLLKAGDLLDVSRTGGKFTVTYGVKNMLYGKAILRVYKNGGLGREIEIISKAPWKFYDTAGTDDNGSAYTRNIAMDATNYTSDISLATQLPTNKDTGYGKPQGSPLNIYINVPANMPQSTFPLVFTFESRNQWIYPNSVGVLTTTTGSTTFANGGSTDIRIMYQYTIEWADYDPDGMIIVAPFKFNVVQANNTTGSDKVCVSNEYFESKELSYTR